MRPPLPRAKVSTPPGRAKPQVSDVPASSAPRVITVTLPARNHCRVRPVPLSSPNRRGDRRHRKTTVTMRADLAVSPAWAPRSHSRAWSTGPEGRGPGCRRHGRHRLCCSGVTATVRMSTLNRFPLPPRRLRTCHGKRPHARWGRRLLCLHRAPRPCGRGLRCGPAVRCPSCHHHCVRAGGPRPGGLCSGHGFAGLRST